MVARTEPRPPECIYPAREQYKSPLTIDSRQDLPDHFGRRVGDRDVSAFDVEGIG